MLSDPDTLGQHSLEWRQQGKALIQRVCAGPLR
jgi:hypothetical protein